MANETQQGESAPAGQGRFYSGFKSTLKWSVVAIASLLSVLALFLVR